MKKSLTVLFTCPTCKSAVHVYPKHDATQCKCDICSHEFPVNFSKEMEEGNVDQCPMCQQYDFYIQKDFNRIIGVGLFIVASILSIWTYGLSFVVLYGLDFFLFQKLHYVVVCYKCSTIFRHAKNWKLIPAFDHEINDRVIYSGHSFQKEPIKSVT